MKLFKILVQVRFTTSKAVLTNQTKNIYEFPRQIPNDLRLRNLENKETFEKFQKWWRQSPQSTIHFRDKTLTISVKNYAKAQNSKFFVPVQFSLVSSLCFICFVHCYCSLLSPFLIVRVFEPKTSHRQFRNQQH